MKFQTDIAVEVRLVTSSEVGSGRGKYYNSYLHISHKGLSKNIRQIEFLGLKEVSDGDSLSRWSGEFFFPRSSE